MLAGSARRAKIGIDEGPDDSAVGIDDVGCGQRQRMAFVVVPLLKIDPDLAIERPSGRLQFFFGSTASDMNASSLETQRRTQLHRS